MLTADRGFAFKMLAALAVVFIVAVPVSAQLNADTTPLDLDLSDARLSIAGNDEVVIRNVGFAGTDYIVHVKGQGDGTWRVVDAETQVPGQLPHRLVLDFARIHVVDRDTISINNVFLDGDLYSATLRVDGGLIVPLAVGVDESNPPLPSGNVSERAESTERADRDAAGEADREAEPQSAQVTGDKPQSVTSTQAEELLAVAQRIVDSVAAGEARLEALTDAATQAGREMNRAGTQLERLGDHVRRAGEGLESAEVGLDRLADRAERIEERLSSVETVLSQLQEAAKDLAGSRPSGGSGTTTSDRSGGASTVEPGDLNSVVSRLERTMERQAETTRESIADLAEEGQAARETMAGLEREARNARESITGLEAEARNARESIGSLEEEIGSLKRAMDQSEQRIRSEIAEGIQVLNDQLQVIIDQPGLQQPQRSLSMVPAPDRAPESSTAAPGEDRAGLALSMSRARRLLTNQVLDGFKGAEATEGIWAIRDNTASQVDPDQFFAKLRLPVVQSSQPFRYTFTAESNATGWVGAGLHVFADGVQRPAGYGHGRSLLVWLTQDPEFYGDDQLYLELYRSDDDVEMERVLHAAVPFELKSGVQIELLFEPSTNFVTIALNGQEQIRYHLFFPVGQGVECAVRALNAVRFSDLAVYTR